MLSSFLLTAATQPIVFSDLQLASWIRQRSRAAPQVPSLRNQAHSEGFGFQSCCSPPYACSVVARSTVSSIVPLLQFVFEQLYQVPLHVQRRRWALWFHCRAMSNLCGLCVKESKIVDQNHSLGNWVEQIGASTGEMTDNTLPWTFCLRSFSIIAQRSSLLRKRTSLSAIFLSFSDNCFSSWYCWRESGGGGQVEMKKMKQ